MSSISEVVGALRRHMKVPSKFEEIFDLMKENSLINLLKKTIGYGVVGIADVRFFGEASSEIKYSSELSEWGREELKKLKPEPEIIVREDQGLRICMEKYSSIFRFERILQTDGPGLNRVNTFEPEKLYQLLYDMARTAEKFILESILFIEQRKSSSDILYVGSCLGLNTNEAYTQFEPSKMKMMEKSKLDGPILRLKEKKAEVELFILSLEEIKKMGHLKMKVFEPDEGNWKEKTIEQKQIDMTKYESRPYRFLLDNNQVEVKGFKMYIQDIKSEKLATSFKILCDVYYKDFKHRGSSRLIKRLQAAGLVKISKYNTIITDVGKQLIEDLMEIYPDRFPQKPIVAEEPKIKEQAHVVIAYDPHFLRLTRLKDEPRNEFWGFYLSGRWIMNEKGEKVIPFYNHKYEIAEDAKDLKKIVGGEYNRAKWEKAPVLIKTLNKRGALKISKRGDVLEFRREFANLIKNLPESYKDLEKIEYK